MHPAAVISVFPGPRVLEANPDNPPSLRFRTLEADAGAWGGAAVCARARWVRSHSWQHPLSWRLSRLDMPNVRLLLLLPRVSAVSTMVTVAEILKKDRLAVEKSESSDAHVITEYYILLGHSCSQHVHSLAPQKSQRAWRASLTMASSDQCRSQRWR